MKWPDLLQRQRPEPDETIRYGDAATQLVDLWLPKGNGPHPTVLMVHGGCWQTEIADRRIMNWIADDLRKRGIAVWNIDYRGVDRAGGGYPGTFEDVAAAADALPRHARQYRLDLSRLVAVGHSAGGHLALWLAGRIDRGRAPFSITLELDRPGEAEALQREVGEPLSPILTALPGQDGVETQMGAGRWRGTIYFARGVDEAAAEAAVRAALPAMRAVLPPGSADPAVRTESSGIPQTSPLFAAHPVPIMTVIASGALPDLKLTATPPGTGCGTEVVGSLVGAPTPDRPDVFADTSAAELHRIRGRQILVNGVEDKIVPIAFAASYRDRRQEHGEQVRLETIPRTGHVELIAPETTAWRRQAEIMEQIFREKPIKVRVRVAKP
jgi:acetyl esterase/lipase